jgi:glycosyltransferase involved in cell wall biosynthesis
MYQMISVIIPALNEEKYIGGTLRALRAQTHRDFEVIVADNGSADSTRRIAEKLGARVVVCEKLGADPARNCGARAARGELLVFADADTVLPENTLEQIEKLMRKREDVIGGTTAFYPHKGGLFDWILFGIGNIINRLSLPLGTPLNVGCCFFYRKGIFWRVGELREDMALCETHDISIRPSNLGKFVYLNVPVFTSIRRFAKEGYRNTVNIYVAATAYYLITRQVPESMFKFARYS